MQKYDNIATADRVLHKDVIISSNIGYAQGKQEHYVSRD